MDVFTAKSILQGIHLAIYSTIKPGGLHRLRLESSIDHVFSNILATSDYILEATEIGEKVRKGELAATYMGMGRLMARALREAYRWNPRHVYPDYIVPGMIYGFSIAYGDPDSVVGDYGKVRRGLELVLLGRDWREIKSFLDALKSVHRNDMLEHLAGTGVTGLGGIRGEVSFMDVFKTLGSRWPGFRSLDLREGVNQWVKKLLDYYHKVGDANNALIMLYIDLVEPLLPSWAREELGKAVSEGLMLSRNGSRILFNTDIRLRKEGYSYEEYTALLGVIAGLAVYDGLRP